MLMIIRWSVTTVGFSCGVKHPPHALASLSPANSAASTPATPMAMVEGVRMLTPSLDPLILPRPLAGTTNASRASPTSPRLRRDLDWIRGVRVSSDSALRCAPGGRTYVLGSPNANNGLALHRRPRRIVPEE